MTTIEQWNADCHLDAKGLACPMPLLKLKQQLNRMAAGECISVETTDGGSVPDFDAFCNQAGHQILAQIVSRAGAESAMTVDTGGTVYRFLIRKSALSGQG